LIARDDDLVIKGLNQIWSSWPPGKLLPNGIFG